MMKLFEKYLLAVTNQRIPMPKIWQKSLGLDLEETKQIYEDNVSEITGYRFQQDETLNRGYVHREVRSLELDDQAKYLISLYLNALKEHKHTDFTPYFNVGVSTYSFPFYTTRVNVIRGQVYSIYGNTVKPTQVRIYSSAAYEEEIVKDVVDEEGTVIGKRKEVRKYAANEKVFADFIISAIATDKQYRLDTNDYLSGEQSDIDEYIEMEIKSYVPLVVLQGSYTRLSMLKKILPGSTGEVNNLFPSAGIEQLDYANKLLPLLLDMTITDDSPQEEKDLLTSDYLGDTFEEKVKRNTKGIYDVDKYIGGKFLW
ncbi:MAG: hypothetical protein NC218_02380 [Acetobacter sp.]|nr:hypothetical protein [Acetobacter sp.]